MLTVAPNWQFDRFSCQFAQLLISNIVVCIVIVVAGIDCLLLRKYMNAQTYMYVRVYVFFCSLFKEKCCIVWKNTKQYFLTVF